MDASLFLKKVNMINTYYGNTISIWYYINHSITNKRFPLHNFKFID